MPDEITQIGEPEKPKKSRSAEMRERRAKAKGFASYAQQQAQRETVKADEARAILRRKWRIQNDHILEAVRELGIAASESLKIGADQMFWLRGPAGSGPEEKSAENEVRGECWATRDELFALWSFSIAWEKGALASTFDEFLEIRLKCRTDPMFLGNEILGMDLHEKPHARWADLLCHFDPASLKLNYTQEDMKAAFQAISDTRIRMLIASRNSYKSSFALRVFLTQAILFCPDVRCLIVSETKPLSKKMAAGFKKMMSITNLYNRTIFQKLFPEILTDSEEGDQLVWENPMAHLDLLAPTCESTSMDSTVAGNRADVLLFDDPISNMSCGTAEQRSKSVEKFDALMELLEVGCSATILGTPWSGEGDGDLYMQLMARNERSHSMAVIIDPCWTVKPEAKHKDLWSLEESDVELMFPARLTWAVLQKKLREGDPLARTFRTQSLCQWIPDVEESAKLQFDRDLILKHVVKGPAVLGESEIRATMDIGFSKTRYADASSITLSKVEKNDLIILEQSTGHWRTSEKAEEIVRLHRKYDVKLWAIEFFAGKEDLEDAVRKELLKYGISHFPLYWIPPDNQRSSAKWRRIKSIELPLHSGRVRLVEGLWNNELLDELDWLDEQKIGYRSAGNHHDDRADSLSLAVKLFLPREDEDKSSAIEEMEKQQNEARRRQETYDMIFGGQSKWRQGVPQLSEKDNNPGYTVQRGPHGIPGLRSFPQQAPDPNRKPMTFGDIQPKK